LFSKIKNLNEIVFYDGRTKIIRGELKTTGETF
jgi:hypothetical protein